MIRAWVAVALLAVSWLPGLAYFGPAGMLAWLGPLLLGTALLAGWPVRMPAPRESLVAILLLVPTAVWMPWPYRAIPLLALFALGLLLVPMGAWRMAAARGCAAAALVLLAQAVAMLLYTGFTARSHELPWPLPALVGLGASLLGADVAVEGHTLAISAIREVHRVGLTWELLLDPATWAFLVGGLALQGMGMSWKAWRRAAGRLCLVVLVWLPVRAGLVVGLIVQRAWRADPQTPLNASDFLVSSWTHLGLLAILVLLLGRLLGAPNRSTNSVSEEPEASFSRKTPRGVAARLVYRSGALLLIALGVGLGGFAMGWEPLGQPKAGRVCVVERHSSWEPTTTPYDRRHYGEAGSYTYAAIYDYCSHFFTMSRLMPAEAIDDQSLADCDVLLVKTPTAPYRAEEVAAILRFVERGGGLLLIGEHTNVFKSSTYLNQIAEPLGFCFRADALFEIGSPYVQHYRPPALPHPVVAGVPPMELAVSCSIEPGWRWGRAIVQSTGLWSLPPDYATENYFPEAQVRSDARVGAFIQLWGTTYGRGRVLAWTDSTIFSSFCAFEPGKPELMLGMLQWLNHQSPLDDPRWRVLVGVLAVVLLGLGLTLGVRQGSSWTLWMAAALLGNSMAAMVLAHPAMPAPQATSPLVEVVVDRTLSQVPLAQGGFTHREGRGYGLLEQSIPRLGYVPVRRCGAEVFGGQALLILCPTRAVDAEYRRRLVEYVRAGGRVLVVDSSDNRGSTAGELLEPFGLALGPPAPAGTLHTSEAWPALPVETAGSVEGGTPILWSDATPVATEARLGRGTLIVVGCGTLLNDTALGRHWMVEPDAATQTRYALWYGLLERAVAGRRLGPVPGP